MSCTTTLGPRSQPARVDVLKALLRSVDEDAGRSQSQQLRPSWVAEWLTGSIATERYQALLSGHHPNAAAWVKEQRRAAPARPGGQPRGGRGRR